MSASEVHACVNRARRSNLVGLDPWARTGNRQPSPKFHEISTFITVGLKYVLPAEKGPPARGLPTSYGAEPLRNHLVIGDGPCPVWPSRSGGHEGYAFAPIYRTCVSAVIDDRDLYELLALADALRDSDAKPRERQLAVQEFEQRCRVNSNRPLGVAR